MRRPVIIQFGISNFFGWGVYGLNLALNWVNDPELDPICSWRILEDEIEIDELRWNFLSAFIASSHALSKQLSSHSGGTAEVNAPMLLSLGNGFDRARAAHNVNLSGDPIIGLAVFENPNFSQDQISSVSDISKIITGSKWNERILSEHGVSNVETVLQGVDPTLFHPAPRSGIMRDKFLIFSGGKLEVRKGQDLVLSAFRIFSERHPEAMLVTAWHSPWPEAASSLNLSKRCAPIGFDSNGQVDVGGWARVNGIAAHQIIDLGPVANALMPQILREMDVAVFPNRAEGGTNLVAMECMACGVPTILSNNTGHLDLIEEGNCYALTRQSPIMGMAGWGESDVEEIVEQLERVWSDRAEAIRIGSCGAALMAKITWTNTARKIKEVVLNSC